MDIEKLKQKILDLAIRGQLVPQDPSDEPASVLIEKIKKEKEELIKQGKIKASKNESYIYKGADNCYYEKKFKLSDVLNYIQPTNYIVNSTDYCDDYSTPVLTAGKTFILGYTNEKNGIFKTENEAVIIFDDFTTASHFVDFDFKVKSSAMKILKSTDVKKFNIKYLYYLLNNLNVSVDTHKRFWISIFANLEVVIPNLWYQNLVVDYLDILFYKCSLINSDRNDLNNYIEKSKAKILELFFGEDSCYKSYYDYSSEKLNNICSKITKGSTPTTYGFDFLESGINFVKVENVNNNCIDKNSITCYISKEAHEFQKRSQLKENDILFSIAGTIGRTCLVKKDDLPANTNQAFAIISGYYDYVLPKYLLYYLEWAKYKSTVDSHGGGMLNTTLGGLKNLNITYPIDINVQLNIIKKIEKSFFLLSKIYS